MSDEVMERIAARLAETMDENEWAAMFSPDGLARTASWECEDGWYVQYTTERVRHGRNDGLFLCMVFKPVGRGSRSRKRGTASEWQRVTMHRCSTRREARSFAERYYYEHSPKAAVRHGKVSPR